MKKTLLSAIMLTICTSNAYAVTLEQALTSGYNSNEELKIIRTEFFNEIEQFSRALAGFMPRVYAGFESTDSKIVRKSSLSSITDNITTDKLRNSKTITVEQPIFNGGSSVAELKAAQSAFKASRGKYYASEQKILLNAITTYVNCVELKEKYVISKISVKSNRTQFEAIKEKFKLGESTETEVASAEAGLAGAEANQALAYANFEAVKANFARIFGIEALNIKMPLLPVDLPNSLDDLIKKALAMNPSIYNAHYSTKASKANEYVAKAALLPEASFSIRHGYNEYLPEDITTSSINNKSTAATLSVRVPILARGGAEYSDIRKAKNQTRKAATQLDNQIKVLKANSKASWEVLRAAKLCIEASTKAVKAAEVAYKGVIQEEMLGSKTIINVLNAEDRLNKAREAKVEANKEFILAAYRIKALLGELTAKSLKLSVEYFEPEKEFKKLKLKIVGF